jgi:transcriptional regulator of heat shock response
MATTEKTSKVVERLAETTRDSYQTVVDHAVGLQERNVRFAQGMVDGTIKELRYQAESNRSVVGELFERAEDQRDAYQALVEQSLDAYVNLAYAPFTYVKEGLEATRKAAAR